MKMCNLQLMMVISILETVFSMAADLEITRKRPPSDNGQRRARDSFKIPSSLRDKKFNCETFNAKKSKGDGCPCLCPRKYSTFIFYNKTWGCRENKKVRTLLVGGDKRKLVYFEKENATRKLRMFKVNDKKKVNLDGDNGRNCSLNAHSSSYIRCNGTEDNIPEGNAFKLNREATGYFLEVSNTTSLDFITGRIIKLTINCGKGRPWNTTSFVLLFKYEGSFSCTISTSTLQPIATTKPFGASSLSSPRQHATSTVAQGSSSTSQVPSTIPFTSSMVTDLSRTPSSTLPTTIVVGKASPTTLAKRPTTSDSPFKDPVVASRDPGHEREGKSSPVALIAGVTVAILVIFIIIAVLVYRHRYSGDNSNSGKESEEKRKTALRSLDGITLVTLDNEDHYKALTLRDSAVYESVRDGEADIRNSRKNDHSEGHIYAPLNISEGENIYGHRNNKEIVIQDTRPKINGPISVHHRVYDLMEELVMDPLKGPVENGENGSEPVYNVLEGSCLDGPQSPAYFGITSDSTDGPHYNYIDKGNYPMSNVSEQKETSFYAATDLTEPVYNTLEAPVTENDGDPVYDVLEAPEDA